MRFSVYLGAFAAAAAAASTPEVAVDALAPAPIDFFAQTSVETMTYTQPIHFGKGKKDESTDPDEDGTEKGMATTKNKKGLNAGQEANLKN